MSLGRSGEGIITSAGPTEGVYAFGPDVPPTSHDPADDEFDGSAVDTAGTRRAGATAWTALNLSTTTVSVNKSALILNPVAATGDHLRGYEQVLPGGNWRYRDKMMAHITSNTVDFHIAFRRTANSKLESFGFGQTGQTTTRFRNYQWTNENSFSGEALGTVVAPAEILNAKPIYLESEYDGTSLIMRYSFTGYDGTFKDLFTRAVATFLGGAADRIAIVAETSVNTANIILGMCDWHRRMA